ncbi:MAG: DNA repair protein RecN [Deltaproteobacteria bacterium]
MLVELAVRNLAIFDDVQVAFSPGLNIVTGETGAGKSILVEAIRLALGEKADPGAVRSGEEEAEVSARFDLSERADLVEPFEAAGLPWSEELILSRIIPAAGRSRAYLNGRMVSQSSLAELAPRLVEQVSQHSVHLLLSRSAALIALDRFSGTTGRAADMRRLFREIGAARRAAAEAAERAAGARERAEAVEFRIAELERASLSPGEEETLAADLAVLRNAAKMLEALRGAEEALCSSEQSSAASLSFAAARIREAAAVDPRLRPLLERVQSIRIEAEELGREVAGLCAGIDPEGGRLDRMEERLSEIRRLTRKYGMEVPGLIAHLAELRAERESLAGAAEEAARLRKEQERLEAEGIRAAAELSRSRAEGAGRMGREMEKELTRVDLPGARFAVELVSRESRPGSLSASGFDEAEFLFTANPGQEMRPLAQTASGGELSRVMLALRNVSSTWGERATMVFDEIDTGIGGKVAERVGARLKELSAVAQVICVTHLPQVAAFADSHLAVVKRTARGRVTTGVQRLSKQDRIRELARMISGAEVTEEAQAHARELIEGASRR